MPGKNGVILIIAVLLVLFSILRRVRAFTTRQKVHPAWLALRLAVFAVWGGLVLVAGVGDPLDLAAGLSGLAAGVAVGWFGLRRTTFERGPVSPFYPPNRYVGFAVFALFLLRLVYKFATGIGGAGALAAHAGALAQFTGDLLTSAVFFVLIGYYTFTYAILILRNRESRWAA